MAAQALARFDPFQPELVVRHRLRGAAGDAALPRDPDALELSTCQRDLQISRLDDPERLRPLTGWQTFRGAKAYQFLLEFASGLHSEIRGETNVFGQLKAAWREFGSRNPRAARVLGPLVDRLIRDTREIRTHFLRGVGEHSYATLARRLLQPGDDARVLIVGYGALGRSMARRFEGTRLALYNRTVPAVLPAVFERIFGSSEEGAALSWATHVVVCIPSTPPIDAVWAPTLCGNTALRVLHFDTRRLSRSVWSGVDVLFTLDDVFDLERTQSELRSRHLEAAAAACAERARSFETRF